MLIKNIAVAALVLFSSTAFVDARPRKGSLKHVILLSVDGMHQKDLVRFVADNPKSAFATLLNHGIEYTNAAASKPSDSFPGLTAQITGGSPKTTGIWYDDSYDRTLFPPGSDCKGSPGANTLYAENIDFNGSSIDAGGGINVKNLPLKLVGGKCTPVYPHSFLRVNTIFEVARKHKLHTAWTDKHPAYDIVNGPSGKGVEDLYTPEINAVPTVFGPIAAYDKLHWDAINNWVAGLHQNGKPWTTPNIFGGNFQVVSVVQKTIGYLDANATPSPTLLAAFKEVDTQLGKLIANLKKHGIYEKTLLIVSAKHGQSPIDRKLLNRVNPDPTAYVGNISVAHFTGDDVGLFWLQNANDSTVAASDLYAHSSKIALLHLWEGPGVAIAGFGNPATDPRVPDIIIQTVPGAIYTDSKTKIAEHGGFNEDDTHVLLVAHNPRLRAQKITEHVSTRQIAPTILKSLGLNPGELEAVSIEHTKPLPGFF